MSDYFGDSAYGEDGRWVSGSLGTTRTGGGVMSWQNLEEGSIIIDNFYVDLTANATSTVCTVDFGVTATSATTSNDALIDGANWNSSATERVWNIVKDAGTNGVNAQKLATGKWITGSEITGNVTGIAGTWYCHYRKVRP